MLFLLLLVFICFSCVAFLVAPVGADGVCLLQRLRLSPLTGGGGAAHTPCRYHHTHTTHAQHRYCVIRPSLCLTPECCLWCTVLSCAALCAAAAPACALCRPRHFACRAHTRGTSNRRGTDRTTSAARIRCIQAKRSRDGRENTNKLRLFRVRRDLRAQSPRTDAPLHRTPRHRLVCGSFTL